MRRILFFIFFCCILVHCTQSSSSQSACTENVQFIQNSNFTQFYLLDTKSLEDLVTVSASLLEEEMTVSAAQWRLLQCNLEEFAL